MFSAVRLLLSRRRTFLLFLQGTSLLEEHNSSSFSQTHKIVEMQSCHCCQISSLMLVNVKLDIRGCISRSHVLFDF